MGLFDVDGFGSKTEDKSLKVKEDDNSFVENAFDKSIVDNINPLVKVEVINNKYNLGKLLTDLGHDINGSNLYCPFHPDEATGKMSAKYHSDTDLLYCFSENKMYSAYHAIKLLYGIDTERVFRDIWKDMTFDERHEIMDRYDNEEVNKNTKSTPDVWKKYAESVLGMFRQGKVSYRQHKNALYKVLKMINESKETS